MPETAETMAEVPVPQRAFLLMYYPDGKSIRSRDLLTIIEEIESLDANVQALDIILHSTGGDIYTAYKIIHVIRGRVKNVTVAVPVLAKSAATLMTLGCDRIVMASHSELGPLDLPMEHPESGIQISALDAVRSVEYFASVLDNSARRLANRLWDRLGLSRARAAELALDAVAKYLSPIVDKLDPAIVHKSLRDLEIAERYGREFLTDYMLNQRPRGDRDAERIARELVWEYPSHGFAIGRKEARKLGLIVEDAEKYDMWDDVWSLFLRIHESDDKLIFVIPEKELPAIAGKKQKADDQEEGDAK